MPPSSPSITRNQRFHPTPGRPDASIARKDALPDNDQIMEIEQSQEPPQDAQTGQRNGSKSLSQILKQLTSNKIENGDVIIPAHLVDIVLALSLSMEETALKLNAMESQLKVSNEAAKKFCLLMPDIFAIWY